MNRRAKALPLIFNHKISGRAIYIQTTNGKGKRMILNKETVKIRSALRVPKIITEIYVCILITIYPLWFGTNGYMGISEAKYSFFTFLTLAYLFIVVIITAELMMIGNASEIISNLRRISITQYCLIGYVLCCSISALLSEYGPKVWIGASRNEGLKTILLYILPFLLIAHFGKFKKGYLYLLGAVVTINAVIGILQYAGYNPFSLYPQGYTHHDAFTLYANSFMGTLGNIDFLSAFLSLVIPLFFVYFVVIDKSALILIPFGLGTFLLLLTGVSAGIVGIGAGMFIILPLVASSKRRLSKSLLGISIVLVLIAVYMCLRLTYVNSITKIRIECNWLTAILIFTAILSAVSSYFIFKSGKYSQWEVGKTRKVLFLCSAFALLSGVAVIWAFPFSDGTLGEVHKLLHGEIGAEFGSNRIRIWQESLRLIPEHFWFGGGPDTLAERFSFTFTRFNETLGVTIESSIDNAHNDYLNILVNTGVLSLLFYIAAIASLYIRSYRVKGDQKIKIVLATALICFLVQNFFSFSVCIVSPLFWAALAFLEAETIREN